MVNVPGRSKGCNTCRRRKKGCDLRKPSCGRCIRDNLQCEGYHRPTIFVSHQPDENESNRLVTVRPKPREWQLESFAQQAPSPSNQKCLVGAAYEDRIVKGFFEIFLPKGIFVPRAGLSTLGCFAWAEACVTLSPSSPALRQALCSLSISSVASQNGNEDLVRQGAEFYGCALSRLNQILQDPRLAGTDESVIPTCVLLAMYEQFNGFRSTAKVSQGRNWQTHVSGIGRLIQLRGVQKHMTGLAHEMFAQSRISQFASCYTSRKASAFETNEWMNLPWKDIPRNGRDIVFDILLQLPGALEQCDMAISYESTDDCLAAMDRLVRIHSRLCDWKAQLTAKIWEEAPGDPEADRDSWISEHPEYYMSHGIDVGHWIMLCWASYIAISTSLRRLGRYVPSERRIDTAPGSDLDPDVCAKSIARCIPCFMHPEAGLIGFQNVALPMGTILAYFAAYHREEPAERESIRKFFFDASKSGPFGPLIGGFLKQMQEHAITASNGTRTPSADRPGYEGERSKSMSWYRIKDDEDSVATKRRSESSTVIDPALYAGNDD